MKIRDAVKTDNCAIEILKKNGSDYETAGACYCQCGETQTYIGHDKGFNPIGFVPVCEGCGDDDAFENEVFIETKYPTK